MDSSENFSAVQMNPIHINLCKKNIMQLTKL